MVDVLHDFYEVTDEGYFYTAHINVGEPIGTLVVVVQDGNKVVISTDEDGVLSGLYFPEGENLGEVLVQEIEFSINRLMKKYEWE